MNDNASSSAYMLDSYDLRHARLEHVNNKYIKSLQHRGLISKIKNGDNSKCEVCAETKLTKHIFLFKEKLSYCL